MTAASLGNISTFITKGATPTTYGFKWEMSGVPFLRSECVSERGLDMRQSMFISDEADNALRRSRVINGDILMTITGNVGRVVRLNGVGSANINQHIARIRVKDRNFDPRFVYHYLSQRTMREYYESIVTGQAYPQISLVQVRSTAVPAVPLMEQRRIADALGDADDLIAALERLIAKKQAIKQGMMQELLTGRTRLPGFSGVWEPMKLGAVASMGSGGTPLSSVPKYYGGGIPWVSISDMTRGGKYIARTETTLTEAGLASSAAKLYEPDVVLYAMYASLGECSLAVGRLASSQAILGIKPGPALDREFLFYWLQYLKPRVKLLGQQGTQSNLNAGMVRNFDLRLPRMEEQVAISTTLADVDAELAALERRLMKARATKQGMMQQLLTGRTRLPVEHAGEPS